jgi:predicted dinucleotide-binding enzyme
MNIAILGSGNVGAALASVWVARGHSVRFGTRDPAKPALVELLSTLGTRATAATPADAVDWAEVVLLALPWSATESTVRELADRLAGKVLLDATNPLSADLSSLTVGTTTSGGEMVQQWAPRAKVVKAFNTTGADNMRNALYRLTKLMMPFATDHADARPVASALISACSFEPIDAGPLAMSRTLEPMALFWIKMAYQQNFGPHFGLALLRKPGRQ